MNAHERTLRARRAAHVMWSRQADPARVTAPAREAFLNRFYEATDPALPEAIRRRQAHHALRAHMTGLSLNAARRRTAHGSTP